VSDTVGFLYIDRAKLHEFFAKDVSSAEARVMVATQKPVASIAFNQAVDRAAWKTISSWYLVTQEDQSIHPQLERCQTHRSGGNYRCEVVLITK
jgi:hypothetical protein